MKHTGPDIHTVQFTDSAAVNYATTGDAIDTVVFLGVGQTGANLSRISRALPANVATIGALPYHKFTTGQMESDSVQCVLRVMSEIGARPYHTIAESQAAPAIIGAAKRSLGYFKSITLLEPLGFNKAALGDNPEERYRALMQRSRVFWKQPNQSLRLAGNRTTAFEILKSSLPVWRQIKADYTIGANQDASKRAIELAKVLPVTVYAGENDSLFPYREIAHTIVGHKITLIKSRGGTHLNRATPKGINELARVIAKLELAKQLSDANRKVL